MQGRFSGEAEYLLQTLAEQLPACGAWIVSSANSRDSLVRLRFEILRTGAPALCALLESLGLRLAARSRDDLVVLCNVCRYRGPGILGETVSLLLEVRCSDAQVANFGAFVASA